MVFLYPNQQKFLSSTTTLKITRVLELNILFFWFSIYQFHDYWNIYEESRSNKFFHSGLLQSTPFSSDILSFSIIISKKIPDLFERVCWTEKMMTICIYFLYKLSNQFMQLFEDCFFSDAKINHSFLSKKFKYFNNIGMIIHKIKNRKFSHPWSTILVVGIWDLPDVNWSWPSQFQFLVHLDTSFRFIPKVR